MPELIDTVQGIRSALAAARAGSAAAPPRGATVSTAVPTVALVPTLGGLHAGHLALIDRAKELADLVVVSIFVNPLQFSADELGAYPGSLAEDLALLEASGVSIVFAPPASELSPAGPVTTRVNGGDIALRYEGKGRRGRLDGTLTVVEQLLNIVRPDVLVVGEKDAQQAFLIGRMLVDLHHDVRLERVATVRDADGLAVSTQNRLLDDRQRRSATAIPIALEAAASSADRGPDAVVTAAQSVLTGDPMVELDYLAVVDPQSFLPAGEEAHGRALVLVAVRVGDAHLVDSALIALG